MLKIFVLTLSILSSGSLFAAGFDKYSAANRVIKYLAQNQPEKIKTICLGEACTQLSDARLFSKLRAAVLKQSKIDVVELRFEGRYEVLGVVGDNSNELFNLKIKESPKGTPEDRYYVYYVAEVELLF